MDIGQVLAELRVNEAELLRRFSGNHALVQKFIRKFMGDSTFSSLEKSVEENNFEDMLIYSHTLKGISANLGFDELYRLCTLMVDDLRAEKKEGALGYYGEIRKEYDRIIGCISQLD